MNLSSSSHMQESAFSLWRDVTFRAGVPRAKRAAITMALLMVSSVQWATSRRVSEEVRGKKPPTNSSVTCAVAGMERGGGSEDCWSTTLYLLRYGTAVPSPPSPSAPAPSIPSLLHSSVLRPSVPPHPPTNPPTNSHPPSFSPSLPPFLLSFLAEIPLRHFSLLCFPLPSFRPPFSVHCEILISTLPSLPPPTSQPQPDHIPPHRSSTTLHGCISHYPRSAAAESEGVEACATAGPEARKEAAQAARTQSL